MYFQRNLVCSDQRPLFAFGYRIGNSPKSFAPKYLPLRSLISLINHWFFDVVSRIRILAQRQPLSFPSKSAGLDSLNDELPQSRGSCKSFQRFTFSSTRIGAFDSFKNLFFWVNGEGR